MSVYIFTEDGHVLAGPYRNNAEAESLAEEHRLRGRFAFVGTHDSWNQWSRSHFTHNDDLSVLGCCLHGVDLDRAFCPQGCRV